MSISSSQRYPLVDDATHISQPYFWCVSSLILIVRPLWSVLLSNVSKLIPVRHFRDVIDTGSRKPFARNQYNKTLFIKTHKFFNVERLIQCRAPCWSFDDLSLISSRRIVMMELQVVYTWSKMRDLHKICCVEHSVLLSGWMARTKEYAQLHFTSLRRYLSSDCPVLRKLPQLDTCPIYFFYIVRYDITSDEFLVVDFELLYFLQHNY